MSVNPSAAEAAARKHHSGASVSAVASRQGHFGGRRVSTVREAFEAIFGGQIRAGEATALRKGKDLCNGTKLSKGEDLRRGIESGLRAQQLSAADCTACRPGPVIDPQRQTRAPEPAAGPAPDGASPGSRSARRPADVAGSVQTVMRSHSSTLPWLTVDQNATRNAQDMALASFARSQSDSRVKTDLAEAIRQVRNLEEDISRAYQLQLQSRLGQLSDAQWFELYDLLCRMGGTLETRRSDLDIRIQQVQNSDIWQSPQASAMFNPLVRLAVRFCSGIDYLGAYGYPWIGTARHVEAAVPTCPGERVNVNSVVVPHRLIHALFRQCQGSQQGGEDTPAARYTRAPDLAVTALFHTNGRVLFEGMSHNIVHANGLDAEYLQRLSRDERRDLVGALTSKPVDRMSGDPTHREDIDAKCELLRSNSECAKALVEQLQRAACDFMEVALISESLVSLPMQFELAINGRSGEIVEMNLFSIALLAPGDVGAWRKQHELFNVEDDTVRIHVFQAKDRSGRRRWVSVACRYRQFVLPAADERLELGSCGGVNKDSVEWLLGPAHSRKLGGIVRVSLQKYESRLKEVNERYALAQWKYLHAQGRRSADNPGAVLLAKEYLRLKRFKESCEDHLVALTKAGHRLKTIWAREGDWPAGADEHRKVAALLALVGYLIGHVPLLCCAGDRNLTERLDADIKFLAAIVHKTAGQLPPQDLDDPEWREARSAFTPTSEPGSE